MNDLDELLSMDNEGTDDHPDLTSPDEDDKYDVTDPWEQDLPEGDDDA